MMNSMSPGGPTSYFTYEYAQPFQPLGAPAPPPYTASNSWNMPMSPTGSTHSLPAPPVKFMVGSPQTDGLHRTQSLSNFTSSYSGNNVSSAYSGRHGRSYSRRSTRPSRKRSRHEVRQSYSAPGMIPFPEPQIYPPNPCGPPPPYPGPPGVVNAPVVNNIHVVNRPGAAGKTRYSSRPSNPPSTTTAYSTTSVADSRYGLSGDEISIQPEHCTFLVDAVKEMDLCSRIFSAWVEQAER